MNPRNLALGAAWLLTLAAAYFLGTSRMSAPADDPREGTARAAAPGSKSERPSAPGRATQAATPGTAGPPRSGRNAADRPPRQAVEALTRMSDPLARAQGFITLAESLTADEFRDVVDDFRGLGLTSERMSEYAILLHAWGQTDPEGALDYALKNTGTNFARTTVLASWAGYDPDAALAFANSNAKEGAPNALLVGVIQGIAPNDLSRATDILGTLPRSEERGDALQAILPLVMKDGIDNALAWTDTINESVLRQGAVTYIAQSLTDENPQQAAEIVLALPDVEFQSRIIDDIAKSWAATDMDGAMVWAESLGPDLRAEAARGVVRELASGSPDQAADWMNSIAGTTNLDPAIRSFVYSTAGKTPELAAAWVGEMSNERERERSYHMVLGQWMRTDATAARAWVENNSADIPESIQRRFSEQGDAADSPRGR